MATVTAVANQKGGVAKTTSVHSLGGALAELGMRVLVVDLDPQASLTWASGIDPEQLELSVHDVMLRRAKAADVVLRNGAVHLLPSTIDLAGAERDPGRRRPGLAAARARASRTRGVVLDRTPALGHRDRRLLRMQGPQPSVARRRRAATAHDLGLGSGPVPLPLDALPRLQPSHLVLRRLERLRRRADRRAIGPAPMCEQPCEDKRFATLAGQLSEPVLIVGTPPQHAQVNVTRPLPGSMRPISAARTPLVWSRSSDCGASSGATTTTIPMPRLKTFRISSSPI